MVGYDFYSAASLTLRCKRSKHLSGAWINRALGDGDSRESVFRYLDPDQAIRQLTTIGFRANFRSQKLSSFLDCMGDLPQ